MNFPNQEYKDLIGGTIGVADKKEQDYYAIGLLSGSSQATLDYDKQEREKSKSQSIRDAVKEVKAHNEKKEDGGHGHH